MNAVFPLKLKPLRTDIMLNGNQYYEVLNAIGVVEVRLLYTKAELLAMKANTGEPEQVQPEDVQSIAQPVVRVPAQAWARKAADKLMSENPDARFRAVKVGAGGLIQDQQEKTLLTYERWVWIEEVLKALEAKNAQLSGF